jgi:hypothetical protein
MTEIIDEQVTAELDGGFVVMRLGLRINTLWKPHKWLPIIRANLKMLDELETNPDIGMLAYDTKLGIRNFENVLYWNSFEDLRNWALDPDSSHAPTMKGTMDRMEASDDVGLWHELYIVDDGSYENVYYNSPPQGLGKAAELRPTEGHRKTAAGRLGMTDGEDYDYDGEDVHAESISTD